MITKEKIKKEIDKLPDNLLDEVYSLLKKMLGKSKKENPNFTTRDFQGKLDQVHIRKSANE